MGSPGMPAQVTRVTRHPSIRLPCLAVTVLASRRLPRILRALCALALPSAAVPTPTPRSTMWFKNLIVYRLPAPWSVTAAELEAALQQRTLQPCTAFDLQSRGWVAPGVASRLLHTVNGQHLIALGVEEKLLPASIIRQVALERAGQIEQYQGDPVGRRQLRELKERVADELRARALTRRRTTRAWIDPTQGWFVVDAAGPARAEELVETLRDSLGSLPVRFLETNRAPHAAMAA